MADSTNASSNLFSIEKNELSRGFSSVKPKDRIHRYAMGGSGAIAKPRGRFL